MPKIDRAVQIVKAMTIADQYEQVGSEHKRFANFHADNKIPFDSLCH
jgi:hypothetical protein